MKPEHPFELADEYEIQPLAEPRSPDDLQPLAADFDLTPQVTLQAASVASSPATAPRFADGFLQERNIKWILGIGTILTLGSSLMLVSSQWSGFSAIFKELIILAYTALVFGTGRYTYERLALRRTGTVLLTLSVMLAPIACAAIPFVWEDHSWNFSYVALLIAAAALTTRVGGRVFHHFLRAKQPALTVAYVILALAAAVVPLASAEFAGYLRSPFTALALWCVFAVGTVKVNRTVFHLMERQRRPRIFAFFPMLLLALQYFALFGVCFAANTPLDRIGFGAVLTAIPLLLAADVVADVFKQRTGNLVRPLPWSIMTPLIAGLVACAAGVALAAVPMFELKPPFALVPTALLAAAVMVQIARRTEKQPFVYAAIGFVTLTYRYLPVYFAAATKVLITTTAAAIQEPKLPIAYFGFTFVPLLAVFTWASLRAERRGSKLFATPLKVSAVGLSLLFLALAPTHAKAMFPAALTLLGVFAAQIALFRNRVYVVPALIASIIAAIGTPEFLHGVLGFELPNHMNSSTAWFCYVGRLAGLLLIPGLFLDRLLRRVPVRFLGNDFAVDAAKALYAPCRHTSILLTTLLAMLWLPGYLTGSTAVPGFTTGLLLAGLGLVHAYMNADGRFASQIGTMALGFANVVVGIALVEFRWHDLPMAEGTILSIAVGLLMVQWIASYLLAARPERRISQAFGEATRRCSFGLLWLMVVCHTLLHVLNGIAHGGLAHGGLPTAVWCNSFVLTAWLFDAARRGRNKLLGTVSIVALFALVTSASQAYLPGTVAWLPLWWVGVTAVLALGSTIASRSPRLETRFAPIIEPAHVIVPTLLLLISICSLVAFSPAALAAGTAAPLVLAVWYTVRRDPLGTQLPMALLNWRLLGAVVAYSKPELRYLFQVDFADALLNCPMVAPAVALSAIVWTWGVHRQERRRVLIGELDLGLFQIDAFRYLTYGLLGLTLFMPSLDGSQRAALAATFVLLTTAEFYVALRKNSETHVWKGLAIAAAGVALFAAFGLITFGRGWSMYIVLGLGFAFRLVAHFARNSRSAGVFVRPLLSVGMLLPGVAVAMGIVRHVLHFELGGKALQWAGWNSLALLAAAMFYFREGLVERERKIGGEVVRFRDRRFTVAAATITNVALLLLCRERGFTDPQFYMIPVGITILLLVELLEREIPQGYRDPLRYLGALVILVSPTFHIVTGSWLHLITLMVASTAVILAAIGFRLRAVMYTGTAFLAADLAAMVLWGSVEYPQLLWIAGAALGASILGLGAVCELKREQVQQRLRAVGAALAEWK
jgi:hypothetical protein